MVIAVLTGTEWVQVIGAIGGLVIIIGGVVMQIFSVWINSLRTQIAKVDTKAEIIKTSVDGAATRQEERINSALKELEFLRAHISDQKTTAAILAVAAADNAPRQARASDMKSEVIRSGDSVIVDKK